MPFIVILFNLKGRRVDNHFKLSTYEKENYKNNVGCIIFMVLVYSEIMMESCLSYEKTVNDCRSFYE